MFTISRALEAPRALVWKAHTDCKHLMHWSGPKGFKMRHCKIDLRPGGIHRYCLTAPDGRAMWGRVVYREITEPERLAFIQSFSDERDGIARHPMSPSWPLQMLSELTFTEAGGKTTLAVRWTPFEATAEEIAAFSAGTIGMNQGWTGTFERLAGYLATL